MRWRWSESGAESPARLTVFGILLALTMLGLGLRLWLSRYSLVIPIDGVFYARVAQERLLEVGGQGLHPVWPSLFPLLIAEAARWLHPGASVSLEGLADPVRVEAAGRLVVTLLGSLLVWPVYLLGRRVGGRLLGLTAAALVATHPRLLFYSVQVLSEIPFAFLGLSFFVLLGKARTGGGTSFRRALWAGLAGLGAGAVFLTRPEGILLLVLGVLALVFASGRGWFRAVIFTLVFLAVSAPHVVRVSEALGGFSLGAKSDYNLAQAYAGHPDVPRFDTKRTVYNNFTGGDPFRPPYGPVFEPDPVPRFSFPRFALHHPRTVLAHAWDQLPYSLGAVFSLAYAPWVLLGLAGILARRRRWTGEEKFWFLSWIFYVGLYVLVFVYRRFFILFLPLLLIETAAGLLALAGRPPHWKPRLGLALLFGVVLLGGGVYLGKSKIERETYPVGVKEIGLGLAEGISESELGSRPRVAAILPQAGYYAGCPILFLPELPPGELVAELQARQVAWFVLDPSDRKRPMYREWLDPEVARELGVTIGMEAESGTAAAYVVPALGGP